MRYWKECGSCNGSGYVSKYVLSKKGNHYSDFACDSCNKSGKIDCTEEIKEIVEQNKSLKSAHISILTFLDELKEIGYNIK